MKTSLVLFIIISLHSPLLTGMIKPSAHKQKPEYDIALTTTRFPLQNLYTILLRHKNWSFAPWIRYETNSVPTTFLFSPNKETVVITHGHDSKLLYLYSLQYGARLATLNQQQHDAPPLFTQDNDFLIVEENKKVTFINLVKKLKTAEQDFIEQTRSPKYRIQSPRHRSEPSLRVVLPKTAGNHEQ